MYQRRGQSVMEYTMVVAILAVVLAYMGTSIRRGVQSLVKVTADQVGNQQNADQDFNDAQQGYMVSSITRMKAVHNDRNQEIGYTPKSGIPIYAHNASYNESDYTTTNTITNAGFVPDAGQ